MRFLLPHQIQENPKYVPREWMLVEAYEAANKGDFTRVHDLHQLLQDPYAEGTGALAFPFCGERFLGGFMRGYIAAGSLAPSMRPVPGLLAAVIVEAGGRK